VRPVGHRPSRRADSSGHRRGGPFWYSAGINWVGAIALATGTVAAPLYTGQIVCAAGGMDLSLPARVLVSAAVYLAVMSR
jgi:hypothetical protein